MAADATLLGLNRTKWASTVPSVKIPKGEGYSHLHVAYDSYTYAEASEIGDIVTMQKIPASARVHNVVVYSDDNGTAGVWDVGWGVSADAVEAADQDGFILGFNPETDNGASMQGGGIAAGTGGGFAARPGLFKQFASAVDLKLQCTEASSATAFTLKVAIEYSVD